MMALGGFGGLRSRWVGVAFVLLAVTVVALPRPAPAESISISERAESNDDEPITVRLDQARLFRVPDRTATLVVGNPLIADVTVQPGGMMVVTAKSYGVTNLMALDRAGNTLMAAPIHVIGPVNTVVLHRGIERESYSCLPICERRIVLGDSAVYFNTTLQQGTNRNNQAQSGALPR
jgi:putative type II/III system pilus formation protein